MNKFLSKFVATAVLSAVTITAANAANEAVWNGITNSAIAQGGELVGSDVNVTVTLNADMNPGTTFDFHVVDGSIANSGSYLLCNGAEKVGKYVNLVAQNAAGRATTIGLEFSTGVDTNLTQAGSVLHLIDSIDANCSATGNNLNIIPDANKCVSVFSDNGLNNNGSRVVTEINSATAHVLDYSADVMVACDTPVCMISNSGLDFTATAAAMGVNQRAANAMTADVNATNLGCYTVGCAAPTATYASCTTIVRIQNNTADSNISGVELALTGAIPAGMIATLRTFDANLTDQNVTLNGSAISIPGLSIVNGQTADINITFTPDGANQILPTLVGATVKLTDVNVTGMQNAVLPTNGVAQFAKGISTDFTVTYMNPSFKSFAMITSAAGSTLSATITDSTGATAEAPFADIAAGATVFVWADKAGHATSPLQVAADAAGLNNAWTVEFHVSSAVDAAAYMDVDGGQRTLTLNYAGK